MSDDIDKVFENAITTINLLSSRTKHQSLPRPPPELRANLYGLYKQATEGDVIKLLDRPMGISAEDIDAQNKWDVWNKYRGVSQQFAKREYISQLIESMKVSGVSESSDGSTNRLLNQLENMYSSIKSVKIEKFKRYSVGSVNNNFNDSRSISSPTVRKTETQIITSFDDDLDGLHSQDVNFGKSISNFKTATNKSFSDKTTQKTIQNNEIVNNSFTKDLDTLKSKFQAEISNLNREIQLLKLKNSNSNIEVFKGNLQDTSFSMPNGIVLKRGVNLNNIKQSLPDFDNQSALSSSTYRYAISRPGGTGQIKTLPYLKEINDASLAGMPTNKNHGSNKTNTGMHRFLSSAEDLTMKLCKQFSMNFGMNVKSQSKEKKPGSFSTIPEMINHLFGKFELLLGKGSWIFEYFGKRFFKIMKQMIFNLILAVLVLKITNKKIKFIKYEKQTLICLENGDVLESLRHKLIKYLQK